MEEKNTRNKARDQFSKNVLFCRQNRKTLNLSCEWKSLFNTFVAFDKNTNHAEKSAFEIAETVWNCNHYRCWQKHQEWKATSVWKAAGADPGHKSHNSWPGFPSPWHRRLRRKLTLMCLTMRSSVPNCWFGSTGALRRLVVALFRKGNPNPDWMNPWVFPIIRSNSDSFLCLRQETFWKRQSWFWILADRTCALTTIFEHWVRLTRTLSDLPLWCGAH